MIDHTVREIAALGENTAFAGRFRLVLRREVFVFSPALGVYIDGLGAAIAVTLRRVGDVSTHSLIPEILFILKDGMVLAKYCGEQRGEPLSQPICRVIISMREDNRCSELVE